MKIPVDRELKIELLESLRRGYIDTDNIEVVNKLIQGRLPARVLTRAEIKELTSELENEY